MTNSPATEDDTSIAVLRRQIDIATRASIGIIAIRCPATEVYRVVESIYLSSHENLAAFRLWSQLTGWCAFEETQTLDRDDEEIEFNPIKPPKSNRNTASYLAAFEALPESPEPEGSAANPDYPDNCFYTMIDAHHYMDESGFKAAIRRQAQRSYDCRQRLFLVFPETVEIPDDVGPFLHVIDYEYPGIAELTQLFEMMIDNLDDIEDDSRPTFTEEEIRIIGQNALGMHTTAFESAVSLSITDWHQDHEEDGEPVTFDHICSWVRKYKTEALRKTEVLELQEAIPADQIGGLENYKEWMDKRKITYEPEAIARGITPSRGVLVVGPGGTGKSLIAKAAGAQLGLPVIRFDIGRVFGSFIGQSEGRMRMVLKQLDAMAPAVLMVDEIDKGFAGTAGGGGGDGGTSMRVFGTFLTWMQERDQKRRPIFLVFTANRVQNLPPELMRKGRLDEIWAVNSPNSAERREILKIHTNKRGLEIKDADMHMMVEETEGLVGSEIEALIEQSLIHAYLEDSEVLSLKAFLHERKVLKPLSVSFRADFTAIEDWGAAYARPASKPVDNRTRVQTKEGSRTTIRKPSLRGKPKRLQ